MKRTVATRLLGLALSAGAGAGIAAGQPPVEIIQPVECKPAQKPAEELPPPMSGPPPVACYARLYNPWAYTGYYVGGGCAFKGAPPDALQGTWGWDYKGCGYLPRNVWLKWCCRYQGGTGSYKVNGPPVPNVLAFPPHGHGAQDAGAHGAEGAPEH